MLVKYYKEPTLSHFIEVPITPRSVPDSTTSPNSVTSSSSGLEARENQVVKLFGLLD